MSRITREDSRGTTFERDRVRKAISVVFDLEKSELKRSFSSRISRDRVIDDFRDASFSEDEIEYAHREHDKKRAHENGDDDGKS